MTVDAVTAVALAEDAGRTADALRRDREAMFPSQPPAARPLQPNPSLQDAPEPKGKDKSEPPFDPYMMNGKGPNDERGLENVGKSMEWRQNCTIC